MPVVVSPAIPMTIPSEEDANDGTYHSDHRSKHACNDPDRSANQTKESAEQTTGNTNPDGEREDDDNR